MTRTSSTFTPNIFSTARFISGFVARLATFKVSICRLLPARPIDSGSSFIVKAFSVITGPLITSHTLSIEAFLLLAQPLIQLADRLPGQGQALVGQYLKDVQPVCRNASHIAQVPRRQVKIRIVRRVYNQRLAAQSQRVEHSGEVLSPVRLQLEILDYQQSPFAQPLRQNRAHRSPLHLLGNRVRPVAWLRPVNVTAALPQRAPYT